MRITALVLLFLMLPALAQTPDTTSAWRYYPLQIGNVWEHRGNGFVPGFMRTEIVGDTLIEGTHYFLETTVFHPEDKPGTRFLIRFDTTTANVMARWKDGSESVWQFSGCPLNAPFSAEVKCLNGSKAVGGGYDETVELVDGLVLEGVTYKEFYTPPYSFVNGYVAGIGWVISITGVEPGERYLSYARIDGVEYGTPFPVATEGSPEPDALALTVFPNPLRGTAAVRFTLDRPQGVSLAVYDVLGRRVLSEDLGVQPAGEATHRLNVAPLPSGIYVFRLDGDAGARATARVVRQ